LYLLQRHDDEDFEVVWDDDLVVEVLVDDDLVVEGEVHDEVEHEIKNLL
jgi:hypothetical protein